MDKNQGFSLVEVLLSLSLMTGTSLGLLKQQWQVTQLFNQIEGRNNTLLQLDNAVERLRAEDGMATARVSQLYLAQVGRDQT